MYSFQFGTQLYFVYLLVNSVKEMAYSKNVLRCFFFITSLIGTQSTQDHLDVLERNDDDVKLLRNYDDYDPINDFEYVYEHASKHIPPGKYTNEEDYFKTVSGNPKMVQAMRVSRHDCNRLFGSLYGGKSQWKRCLDSLNKRSDAYGRKIKFLPYSYYNELRHEKLTTIPFVDLTRFSQDYLDVKDLSRKAELPEFAPDYLRVEVGDFRITDKCERMELDEFGAITKISCIPTTFG